MAAAPWAALTAARKMTPTRLWPVPLIAKIGSGSWFAVGSGGTIGKATASGELYLAYNDSVYSDNTGSYSATVNDKGFLSGGGGGDPCPPAGCIQ
jgi:hypothetical protein